MPDLTERDITNALARHLGWSKNLVLPNLQSGPLGFEADLTLIRPSGWAEEFEVKVSKADFRKEFTKTLKHRTIVEGHPKRLSEPGSWTVNFEEAKAEWDTALSLATNPREEWRGRIINLHDFTRVTPHCCRNFWFVMPVELAMALVADIPAYAGLLAVTHAGRGYHTVGVLKEAPKLAMAQKATPELRHRLFQSAYYRFHDLRLKDRGVA